MTQPIPFSELSSIPESRSKPISSRALRFLCRLGQGGMAEIHLASAAPPGPPLVVVKRMHQHHAEDPAAVRMFLDEARLALCLVHPNIVRSERLGMFEGRHGIVMEFLDGQPLHQVLQRAYATEASLQLDTVVQIAIAALDGLHYAHELRDVVGNDLGLVHRDVSPQNLFVTYDGAVKLLDFGIAKNSMQEGRTRTGLLKGKLSYMAPEQARSGDIDRRADVWSLGVVLWEAVTGSRLFKGDNEAATLQQITASTEIAPPSSRRADLPSELEAILMRALRRDPAERYPSAAAMRDDLETWLSSREPLPGQSLSQLMKRLFSREMRDQRQQIQGLLQAQPEVDNVGTLVAPLLGGGTQSGSLRGTQVSSVTDLMQELTRQRRVTTRLLSGVLALVACSLAFGVYWTLVLRPEQAQSVAATLASAPRPSQAALAVPTSAPPPTHASPRPVVEAPAVAPPSPRPVAPAPKAAATSVAKAASAAALAAPVAAVSKPSVASREIEPAAAPIAPVLTETGRLNLDTSPWSIVSVNGRVLGQTPLVGASLPAGTHTLVLSNPEQGLKTTYQVTIAAGRTTARRIGLD